jgi:hypothetical protein
MQVTLDFVALPSILHGAKSYSLSYLLERFFLSVGLIETRASGAERLIWI